MLHESSAVLDAMQQSALATTRSLGASDIELYTAEELKPTLVGSSIFSRHQLTYPSPKLQPVVGPSRLSVTLSNNTTKYINADD